MSELLGGKNEKTDSQIEKEFREFHTTKSLDERKGYLVARHSQIRNGDPTWIRRSGDIEDDGVVFDYFDEGRHIGFIDEEHEGECYLYILSPDGVPELYDSMARPLGQAVGLLETFN